MTARTLTPGDPESAGLCSIQLDRASEYVQRAVEEGILPLADILVARCGKIACHRSFVNPQLQQEGHALDTHSLFYLASFTKSLIATLIMQQVERGSVSLARPVADYIPEFGQRGKEQVTVRHLLCHSSGLPDDLPVPIPTTAASATIMDKTANTTRSTVANFANSPSTQIHPNPFFFVKTPGFGQLYRKTPHQRPFPQPSPRWHAHCNSAGHLASTRGVHLPCRPT